MEKFIWGVASASYQVEGAWNEDGKGESVWDTFSHTPGKVRGGDTGDIACDSYHRIDEDLDIIAQLGIKNYRFSLSWPRIIPDGDGAVNDKGLAYYDRVVDGCIARGIVPWVTLYHWDLPQSLENRFGGWRGRETALAFGRFAGIAAEHFKGRVENYFILNEPQCFINLGYGNGVHAPGVVQDEIGWFRCWHNAMLGYGCAAKAVRAADPDAKISSASTGALGYPASESPEDIEAARRFSFEPFAGKDGFTHEMFLDPICFGRYPDVSGFPYEAAVKAVSAEDTEIIHQKPDFIGINCYNGTCIRAGADGKPEIVPEPAGCPRTACKWPITPSVLYYMPKFVWERYGLLVCITENGMSGNDRVFLDGKVHDPLRIDYLARYLSELKRAITDGAPVKGYFQWSIMDNFEWSEGYHERFGMVYVDYATQKRIPKDSAYWYADVVKNQDMLDGKPFLREMGK